MAKTATKRKKAPEPTAEDVPGQMTFEDTDAASRTIERPPIVLPGAPRPPKGNLNRGMIWIYGPQKIGKTTMASKFPGVWFLATEPGQDWVEVREPTVIHSWEHFLEWCAWVEDNKPMKFADGEPIRFIAIDTVDLLFRMCQSDVSTNLNVEDPSELGNGKGWARLSNEFERVMTKIRRWPFGLLCISHANDKRLRIRGQEKTMYVPDIGAAGLRTLSSAADLIVLLQNESVAEMANGQPTGKITEHQVLLTRPTSWCVAGGRMSNLLPDKLELDREDPYGSILDAIEEGRKNER